jgi:DNA-directed RNA polymerase specialized sigma24 family protein
MEDKLDPKIFKLLQEQDWETIGKELVVYAARRAWIYKWKDGGNWELVAGKTVVDLVQEVITKTIEGRRKWNPARGELRPWLKTQLKSEMNHLYHSSPHSHETAVPESDERDANEGLIGNVQYNASKAAGLAVIGSSIPEPEQALLAKEEKERIEQRVNELLEAVNEEADLEKVVEAIMSGCEPRPRYLADELGRPREVINNCLKRLRRRASKLLMKGDDA